MPEDKFTLDGFLAEGMHSQIASFREQFQDWFALAHDVNRLALRWLHHSVAPNVKTFQEFMVAALMLRAIQSFQAAVILAERGIVADARSLARIVCETAIAVGVAAIDETFIDRMASAHQLHRLKVANATLNDREVGPSLTAETQQDLLALVEEVTQQYGKRGPASINWEAEANRANMSGLYLMVYRGTSGDAVHATALSMERHVVVGPDKEILHLLFGPEPKGLDEAVSASVTSMLHALSALSQHFPVLESELTPLIARYRDLEVSCERR